MMKKTILTSFFCVCVSFLVSGTPDNDSLMQDIRKPLRMSGTKIYTENILHTESEVISLLSISPDIVAQYHKGKNLRSTGTVLLVGGIVTFGGGMALMISGIGTSENYYGYSIIDYDSKYYIGLVIGSLGELMIDGAIVCKIVGKSYMRKSIANYNQAIKSTGYAPASFTYQAGLLDNGRVGLKVTF
jgi:hypothetical protein